MAKNFLIKEAFFPLLWLMVIFGTTPGGSLASVAEKSETARYQANLGAYYWQRGGHTPGN